MHLKLINIFHKLINPFAAADAHSLDHVKTSSFKYCNTFLVYAERLHILVRSLQAMCLWKKFSPNNSPLDGNQIVDLSFWVLVVYLGYIVFSFTQNHAPLFIAAMNLLFSNKIAQSSILIKILLLQVPIMTAAVTIAYFCLTVYTQVDPISTLFVPILMKRSSTLSKLLRVLMIAFENWNVSLTAWLASFLTYHGMFSSYIGLYLITQNLAQIPLMSASSVLRKKYRKLQMYAVIVSNCYQNTIAIKSKVILIAECIVMGACTFNPKLRSTLTIPRLLACSCLYFNICFVMAIGYYFPGRTNSLSTYIQQNWKSKLIVSSGKKALEFKLELRSFRSIRIMIGSVNYYEKGTPLHVIDFLVEKTVSLLLLM